ncbi:hypothetical protein NKG94_09230 [Micromonospora sp. M12]
MAAGDDRRASLRRRWDALVGERGPGGGRAAGAGARADVGGVRPMPRLSAQVDGLRAAGARVVVVTPDAAARTAIGRDLLDPARRGPAAQADTVVDEVAALWA